MDMHFISAILGNVKFGSEGFGVSEVLFVCALGLGVVFIGLICIVIICNIMSLLLRSNGKPSETKSDMTPLATPIAVAPAKNEAIPNRQEFVAAVSAAIAEDLNTDISGIRIHSITIPSAAAAENMATPDHQEFVAAISAAIAEDMGTDISGIRILSTKKL